MNFDVNVWRSCYDQVQILGQYLVDSRPDADGNLPKFTISLGERASVEAEIKELTRMSSAYLDKCKLYPNDALWLYNPKNEGTWESSPKFKYSHLMYKRRKKMTIRI